MAGGEPATMAHWLGTSGNKCQFPEAPEGDWAVRVGVIGPVWGRRRQAGSGESANLRDGDAGPGCLGPERSGGPQAANASTLRRELLCSCPNYRADLAAAASSGDVVK